MEENEQQPTVVIFVGTPDEDPNDYLYIQIHLNGLDIYVDSSDESVDELAPDTFLDVIGKLLNKALLISRQLCLEIELDETIEDLAEEIKPGLFKDVERMLYEARE